MDFRKTSFRLTRSVSALILALVTPCFASIAIDFTSTQSGFSDNISRMLGWEFTVNTPIGWISGRTAC